MKVGWGQSERGRDFKDEEREEERPWDTHNVKAENRHQRLVSVKGKGNEYKQSHDDVYVRKCHSEAYSFVW